MIDYNELEELFHQPRWDEASQVKARVIIEKLIAEIDRLLAENSEILNSLAVAQSKLCRIASQLDRADETANRIASARISEQPL